MTVKVTKSFKIGVKYIGYVYVQAVVCTVGYPA